ncbi:MAG: hypothetical protein GXP55_15705 [Deltaproteobacteria bacterium]|nr:hypothetical protein [Deltaproteobacteria bacterium]
METTIGQNTLRTAGAAQAQAASRRGTQDPALRGDGGDSASPSSFFPSLSVALGPYGLDHVPMDAAAILATASSRIRELDNGINLYMQSIQNRTAAAQNVRQRLQTLERALSQHPRMNDKGKVNRKNPGIDLTAIDPATGQSVGDELRAAGFEPPAGADFWPKAQVDAAMQEVKTELEQLNSGNEMQMIRLQNLISQKSQAVQLTTNMLAKLNRMLESIAAKLGG